MRYDYEVFYKKGKENTIAYALSRVKASKLMVIAIFSISSELMAEIQGSWEMDPHLSELIPQLHQGLKPKSPYMWIEGQLTRKGRIVVGQDEQLQLKIIRLFHKGGLGGHYGINVTVKRLTTLFFWKGMENQVRSFVQQCDICKKFKYDNAATPGLLQYIPIPSQAWFQVTMDFIDGLPSLEGYELIFVVIDKFTKYNHFVGLKHPYSAKAVARAFNDNVVKLHGYPEIFISDRDTVFTSDFWQELFTLQGVSLRLCTSYHPLADGQTEVVNRCLETYLRCVAVVNPRLGTGGYL